MSEYESCPTWPLNLSISYQHCWLAGSAFSRQCVNGRVFVHASVSEEQDLRRPAYKRVAEATAAAAGYKITVRMALYTGW